MDCGIDQKCASCKPAKCCSYVSFQIDTPTTFEEFENLLWQIAHGDIEFFRDRDGWFISINRRCRFLGSNNLCQIYEHRPQICRDYQNVNCDFDGDYDFEHYFKKFEELLAYVRKRFPKKAAARYGTDNIWIPTKVL